MTRQEIIGKIGELQDKHNGSIGSCEGCEICGEIRKLGRLLKYTEKTRNILKKGEDMTTDEIRRLIKKGIKREDIAESLGISEKDLYEITKDLIGGGDTVAWDEITISKDEYMDMKQKMTDPEIAKKLNVDIKTLREWKDENNLKHVKLRKARPNIKRYKELKKDRIPDHEIAKMYDMSTHTLTAWKRENGISGLSIKPDYPDIKEYKKFKRKGKSDDWVCKYYGISRGKLSNWKKKVGLLGYTVKDVKKKEGKNMKTKKEDIKNKKYEEEKEQLVNAYSEKLLKRNKELNDELLEAKKEVESAEMAIKQLKEDIELERDKQKQMELKHENELKEYADEKQLAYMKAREYANELKEAQEETKKQTELYIQTFNNLEKTDRDLENAKQRIKELESREKQLLLRIEEMKRINDPMRHLLKVVL